MCCPVEFSLWNAKLLKKHEVRIIASYTNYTAKIRPVFTTFNNTYGFSAGYGFTDRFNLNLRFENIRVKNNAPFFDPGTINYIEVGTKIKLKEDLVALGIPVGLFMGGETIVPVDPKLLVTFRPRKQFEVNFVPAFHIYIRSSPAFSGYPGVNISFGFSNDLDKWAIRPEIGFDGSHSINAGIGLNFNFKPEPGDF